MRSADEEYLQKINGMHEIHITVDPSQVLLLRLFCMKNNIKDIFAVTRPGGDGNQLMISKYMRGKSMEVIRKCLETAQDMRDFGLTPIRNKVEATMHIGGGPKGNERPRVSGVASLCGYWEFHLKLIAPVTSLERFEELERVAACFGCHVSVNTFKKELVPLVTLRLRDFTLDEAMRLKERVVDGMTEANFYFDSCVQELAVYDDNTALDDAWFNHNK